MRMTRITALLAFAAASPAFAIEGAAVTRSGDTLTVTWSAQRPVDVFVSEAPDTMPRAAKPVSSNDSDGMYADNAAGTVRRYFILREKGSTKVVRVAERELPLAGGTNFRDLGGYPAANGKTVRWGRIFRSAATPLLTDADTAQVKALGLAAMFDLRSSEERQLAPTKLRGIRSEAVEYSMMSMMPADSTAMRNSGKLYRSMTLYLVPQFRMVFDGLLERKGPVMYHCTAGQDRTGVATALILSALGTPRDVILKDYELTTALLKPGRAMGEISPAMAELNPVAKMFAAYQRQGGLMTKPQSLRDPDGRLFLESAFDEIEQRYGSVDAFLDKELGVGPAQIALLRATYLE